MEMAPSMLKQRHGNPNHGLEAANAQDSRADPDLDHTLLTLFQ